MEFSTDAVVIGAGVVGLAVARALTARGLETIVLERAPHIGSETSSRHSEVIHAGIYYPPGSHKAEFCVRGKKMLYDYVESRGIPFKRCGKLIATSQANGLERLKAISDRARLCGVDDLLLLDSNQVIDIEPSVKAEVGLLSPSTGILDSQQFMLSLQGDIESGSGNLVFGAGVRSGRLVKNGLHRLSVSGEESLELGCPVLINATGLSARETLTMLLPEQSPLRIPQQYYAKGHYYSYSGRTPFGRLVYPLPQEGGLGVHATLDLAGRVRFGPDVLWIDAIDYAFEDDNRASFITSIRDYFPDLEPDRLQPDYTGIRPKIVGPGQPDADFLCMSERDHGYPGFVSLHGIESPGLTACLAIADHVTSLL